MNPTEKHSFDRGTQEVPESLAVPFAVYQFIDKRAVSVSLSAGFRKLFGYDDRGLAYRDMDHDMYKDVHPDDTDRIADAATRFAAEGGRFGPDPAKEKNDPGGEIIGEMAVLLLHEQK